MHKNRREGAPVVRDEDARFLEQAIWAIAALRAYSHKHGFHALGHILELAQDQASDDMTGERPERTAARAAEIIKFISRQEMRQ